MSEFLLRSEFLVTQIIQSLPCWFDACGLSLHCLGLECSPVLWPPVLSIKCFPCSGFISLIYVLVAERSCSSGWFASSLKEKSVLFS
ncbi:hypothetical protein Bca4012_036416 [Brassica carinata]